MRLVAIFFLGVAAVFEQLYPNRFRGLQFEAPQVDKFVLRLPYLKIHRPSSTGWPLRPCWQLQLRFSTPLKVGPPHTLTQVLPFRHEEFGAPG
jgi:hypothetical protein